MQGAALTAGAPQLELETLTLTFLVQRARIGELDDVLCAVDDIGRIALALRLKDTNELIKTKEHRRHVMCRGYPVDSARVDNALILNLTAQLREKA